MQERSGLSEEMLFRFLKEEVLPSLMGGDRDAALRQAMLAYLICKKDMEGSKFDALVIMEAAIKDLKKKYMISSEAKDGGPLDAQCSFCGSKPPRVRLGAGANVFICNECVGVFSEIFATPA